MISHSSKDIQTQTIPKWNISWLCFFIIVEASFQTNKLKAFVILRQQRVPQYIPDHCATVRTSFWWLRIKIPVSVITIKLKIPTECLSKSQWVSWVPNIVWDIQTPRLRHQRVLFPICQWPLSNQCQCIMHNTLWFSEKKERFGVYRTIDACRRLWEGIDSMRWHMRHIGLNTKVQQCSHSDQQNGHSVGLQREDAQPLDVSHVVTHGVP